MPSRVDFLTTESTESTELDYKLFDAFHQSLDEISIIFSVASVFSVVDFLTTEYTESTELDYKLDDAIHQSLDVNIYYFLCVLRVLCGE